jgi:hypothetical protein
LLRELDFDPKEIFQFAIDVLHGGPVDPQNGTQMRIYSANDQRWAADFLRDTIWGKPAQSMALTVAPGEPATGATTVDLENLDDAALEAYLEAQARAEAVLLAAAAGRVIDAVGSELPAPAVQPVLAPRRHVFVGSSNIANAEHDPNVSEMVVTFTNGGAYRYRNVSAERFDVFVHAPSAGTWFAQEIKAKPNEFPCDRVKAPSGE